MSLPQERSQAGERALHIAERWVSLEYASCMRKQKLDVIDGSDRFIGDFGLGVGCAHQHAAAPRNQKNHALVVRAGNEHRSLAGEKRAIEDDVRAAAGAGRGFRDRQ